MVDLTLDENVGEWSVSVAAFDKSSPIALLTFVQHASGRIQHARLDRGKLMMIDAAPVVPREMLLRIAERIEREIAGVNRLAVGM